ncbi:YybH family protein [Marinoscillum sp.]|uniref:YybH family protein n=1 Tax=Marinoscillum sp. TaxID=2024838 RepID=UPI003BAB5101
MHRVLIALILAFIGACSNPPREKIIQEVLSVEKAFNDYAHEHGVKAAFLHFAADDAVIVRNNKVYQGHEAIASYFDSSSLVGVQLIWEPTFVECSSSGDLAYTYGSYEFQALEISGDTINATGIFHTVWKKQKNGEWKFVYD